MALQTARNSPVGINQQNAENEINLKSFESLLLHLAREQTARRYGAYFRGWCQAFGEHESILADKSENYWLLGENQLGLVLPKPLIRQLNHEVLLHDDVPQLIFSHQGIQIGTLHFPFENELEKQILNVMDILFENDSGLHLFLTSHQLYGSGSRIFTISNRRPQPIIYKEIGTMKISLR